MGLESTSLVLGIVKLALAAIFPVLLIWLVLHVGTIGRAAVRTLRWLRIVPPPKPPPPPPRVPLEKIAADLCRLSTAIRDVPPEASRARKHGLLLAYDDVLGKAALALDVEQSLGTLKLGMDRDLERLRVEGALRDAGLAFGPRKRQDMP
ncbi:MAG TPA: hypothetical protein VLM05_14485 [Mycobacteriales bacterium]|nr:hypothetical protein [Mycobacteriales bacterium]